ncbi:hypothetical protein PFICI_09096 [Pestalotiopsis fici W106-1]|uniref:Uncharacterized protein n=1 Tax=Pestalotiopsis fici (strain W106-1 / CGMCC3.15140) TaxID=1229662 RepID=W3WZF2_PESFW|nr:uncharacterized protein PFICI_09096 [Pestalotiopsis fici W106-1]ETS79243.1 hypothetical protein PFICI_09096 [Pestalotiopsis fici W106-1]
MHDGVHPTGFLDKRSRRAWNGLLVIIGIIFVTLLVMAGAMVHEIIEFQEKTPEDINNQEQANTWMIYKRAAAAVDDGHHPNAVLTLVPTLETVDSTPGHETNAMSVMIETLITIVTQTVYPNSHTSTTPTPKHPFGSTSDAASSTTGSPKEHPSEATAATSGTISTDAVVKTGLMWCADGQRLNDVYTPCTYVYTEPPSPNGQAQATGAAMQSTPVASSAAGRKRPLSLVRICLDIAQWSIDNFPGWHPAIDHYASTHSPHINTFEDKLRKAFNRRVRQDSQYRQAEAKMQHCVVAAMKIWTEAAVHSAKLPIKGDTSACDEELKIEMAALEEQILELNRQLDTSKDDLDKCQRAFPHHEGTNILLI